MKFFHSIVPLIAAFHLVFATSGVPLVYMFCGENFCSMTFATRSLQAQTKALQECSDKESDKEKTSCEKKSTEETSDEEPSCCAEEKSAEENTPEVEPVETESECHTELHVAQLSVDALQAASSLAFDYVAPAVAVLPTYSLDLQSPQILTFTTSILANPPPLRNDKHILFRSLLI